MTDDDACGTHRGWSRHIRNQEQPCKACKEARNAYDRDRRAAQRAKGTIPDHIPHNRARADAVRTLIARHREEYRALYRVALAERKAAAQRDAEWAGVFAEFTEETTDGA
jgi:hypothetical protein